MWLNSLNYTVRVLLQMVKVCEHLELGGADEGVLVTACEQFTILAQFLSYSTVVCFARTSLLPQVNFDFFPTIVCHTQ